MTYPTRPGSTLGGSMRARSESQVGGGFFGSLAPAPRASARPRLPTLSPRRVAGPGDQPGTPCGIGGLPGFYALVPGSTDVVCAITIPTTGVPCLLGDATDASALAGTFTDPNCIDPLAAQSALYQACIASQTSAATCLAVASSFAHPSNLTGQPVNSVVAQASLCASGAVATVPASETGLPSDILVCVAAHAEGDSCDAGPAGPAGTTLPSLGGKWHAPTPGDSLVCVPNPDQACEDASGVAGIIDTSGICAHAASEGSPCQPDASLPPGKIVNGKCEQSALPEGTPCKVDPLLPPGTIVNGKCVQEPFSKIGAACKDEAGKDGLVGLVAGTPTCVVTPDALPGTPGGECFTDAGHPGMLDKDLACVFAATPKDATCPHEYPFYDDSIGHCLVLPGATAGPPGLPASWDPACSGKDASGTKLMWDFAKRLCVPECDIPGMCDKPIVESAAAPSSNMLPWVLLLGTIAAGAYHLSTMKKRA